MTASESLTAIRQELSPHFGPERSALFLGTLLAYPWHALLRHHFAMVPAAWIRGGSAALRRSIAEAAHALYHPNPADDFTMDAHLTSSQAIIARHAAAPREPYHFENFEDNGTCLSPFFAHACDSGIITRGTYGTAQYEVTTSIPPLLSGHLTPRNPALAARYLHFTLTGTESAPKPDRSHYGSILAALILHRPFARELIAHCHTTERLLAAAGLPLRRRIQLAIASSFFTTAQAHLHPDAPCDLTEWITQNPTAFEP